jgi:hypothetical protein
MEIRFRFLGEHSPIVLPESAGSRDSSKAGEMHVFEQVFRSNFSD